MLVLVVAIVMTVFAAHIRSWWITGVATVVVGAALLAFPIATSSLEAWFALEILVGPPVAVVGIGLATLVATAVRRRQLAAVPDARPRDGVLQAVADSIAPRSKRTSDLGLAGYQRRVSALSHV